MPDYIGIFNPADLFKIRLSHSLGISLKVLVNCRLKYLPAFIKTYIFFSGIQIVNRAYDIVIAVIGNFRVQIKLKPLIYSDFRIQLSEPFYLPVILLLRFRRHSPVSAERKPAVPRKPHGLKARLYSCAHHFLHSVPAVIEDSMNVKALFHHFIIFSCFTLVSMTCLDAISF